LEAKLGFRYAACFLNGYENERDALGWHADDSEEIDTTKPIAVITVGNGRAIQFMEKEFGEKVEVFLEPGSLLLMHSGMQQTHLHRIPKVGHKVGPRISLTYRGLVTNA
jgi:alkylated DNA repair dioxygenase AlkB